MAQWNRSTERSGLRLLFLLWSVLVITLPHPALRRAGFSNKARRCTYVYCNCCMYCMCMCMYVMFFFFKKKRGKKKQSIFIYILMYIQHPHHVANTSMLGLKVANHCDFLAL